MPSKIDSVARGQLVTAKQLNKYGEGVNRLNRSAAKKPQQNDDVIDPSVQAAAGEDPDSTATNIDDFIESGRITSLVQVFDDEGTNYAEIDRIEVVTLVNGTGKTLKLTFNNPPV